MFLKLEARFLLAALCLLALSAANFRAQKKTLIGENKPVKEEAETNLPKPILESVLPNYYNPQDGVSINELIKRALDSNQELAAARLVICYKFSRTAAKTTATRNRKQPKARKA